MAYFHFNDGANEGVNLANVAIVASGAPAFAILADASQTNVPAAAAAAFRSAVAAVPGMIALSSGQYLNKNWVTMTSDDGHTLAVWLIGAGEQLYTGADRSTLIAALV